MHLRLLLIIIFTASAAAQVNLCNPTKASIVDQTSGVIVQKVTLRGTWGSNVATVFLPGKEIVDGAVLFSHSIIQSNNGFCGYDSARLDAGSGRRSRDCPGAHPGLAS
jgi:hypothetical protein